MTTINVRNRAGMSDVRFKLFEGATVDADGCRFYVASTDRFALTQRDAAAAPGVLIAFGTDKLKDPESTYWSDYFAFGADDDKKVIAQQLREMADWFESQA